MTIMVMNVKGNCVPNITINVYVINKLHNNIKMCVHNITNVCTNITNWFAYIIQ